MMDTFDTVEAVLDFAVRREQETVEFYENLAGRTDNLQLKKALTAFAGVEKGHKKKLLAAKEAGLAVGEPGGRVVDLKIGDYLVEVDAGPEMSFQDALVVAMKREKAAMELYADMASRISNAELKAMFEKLAREEAGHKLSFETAYEEHFMQDN
ncbi:ferritin family protein [Pontiella agarivorans]|uniref:Ferritin family protein n=1 Tax=Pontiella agarivorans TaxID=3038953 RepID=A0ABU5N0D0_9BACT|nr:ferritin family protein [Pontiella agarivorans]MDZ8119894.1 ferritin family protein [Pontiella agarivorans]